MMAGILRVVRPFTTCALPRQRRRPCCRQAALESASAKCRHVAWYTRKVRHQTFEGELVDIKVFRARLGTWAATGLGIEERKIAVAERNAYETRKPSKPTDAQEGLLHNLRSGTFG